MEDFRRHLCNLVIVNFHSPCGEFYYVLFFFLQVAIMYKENEIELIFANIRKTNIVKIAVTFRQYINQFIVAQDQRLMFHYLWSSDVSSIVT